jgi:hypothetical protein
MSKLDLCAAQTITALMKAEYDNVLVLVPNVGAAVSMRAALLKAAALAGAECEARGGSMKINFSMRGYIQIETMLDYGSPDKQRFERHEEAAAALVDLIKQHPNLEVVAVAPNHHISKYARDRLCDEASRAGLGFQPSKLRALVQFDNGSVVRFFDVREAADLRGRTFRASWSIAPQQWRGREMSAVLEDRCSDPVPNGRIESNG